MIAATAVGRNARVDSAPAPGPGIRENGLTLGVRMRWAARATRRTRHYAPVASWKREREMSSAGMAALRSHAWPSGAAAWAAAWCTSLSSG